MLAEQRAICAVVDCRSPSLRGENCMFVSQQKSPHAHTKWTAARVGHGVLGVFGDGVFG